MAGAERTWLLKFIADSKDLERKAQAARKAMEGVAAGAGAMSGKLDQSGAAADNAERKLSLAERTVQRFKDEVARAREGLTPFAGQLEAVAVAGEKLKGIGGGMQSLGGQLTKYVTAPVAGAATAVAGLSATLGFKRLVGIDTAMGQFKGLGYEAEKVMAQVDKGVTGTALSMADGAAMAVGILATGAVPMEKLEEQIKRVSNVSAAYGVEAAHAGNLLNNVLVKGKVTWGDLSQMQQNQIPVVSQLAEYYNVTGEEIMALAKKGTISIDDLNTVLDTNAGAAAEEHAKTWQGVTANIRSNLGRIGAAVLGGGFEVLKEQAGGFLELLRGDELKVWSKAAGEHLGRFAVEAVEKFQQLKQWWDELTPSGRRLAASVAGIAIAAGPTLSLLGKFVSGIGTVMTLAPKVWAALTLVGKGFGALTTFMLATPIGLIITGVAALTAGLVYFFTQTEKGKETWSRIWAAIQDAAERVAQWWTNTAVPALQAGWEMIQAAAQAVSEWWTTTLAPALQAAWDTILAAAVEVAAWYQTHVAPVFTEVGELIRAVVERWVKPALQDLSRWWGETWAKVQELWRRVGPPLISFIQTAFDGLRIVLSRIWNHIKIVIETVLGVIRGIIRTITALIKGDWQGAWNAIRSVFSTIWDGTKRVIENAVGGVRDWLSATWEGIKRTAGLAWQGVRDKIMGVVNPLRDAMTRAFEVARDGIGRAVDGIRGAAAKPINFVINTVWNDGLRAALNLIPGVNLARAKPIPGFDRGGWTGPGPRLQPAGIVHADEYVLSKPEVRRMGGPAGVERWKLERLHSLPGYALGGAVRPVPGGHYGWNGGRYKSGGWHGGLDFGGSLGSPAGTPIRAMWPGQVTRALRLNRSYGHHVVLSHGGGWETLYAHMSRLHAVAGRMVQAGQVLGLVGNTGNSFGAHLHLEVRRNGRQINPEPFLSGAARPAGADGSGSLIDLPGKIAGVLRSAREGLTGPWGSLVKQGVFHAIDEAKTWGLQRLGIPGYSRGIRRAPAGPAWVGEGGKELLWMNGGETVVPHRESLSIAAGRSNDADQLREAVTLLGAILAALKDERDLNLVMDEGDIRRVVRHELRKKV